MPTRIALARIVVVFIAVLVAVTLVSGKNKPMVAHWPDYRLHTPLHQAAMSGDYDQVATLITAGADVNAKDENGATPLQYAVRADHPAIVTLLITKGADVNIADRIGETPLYAAALHNTTIVTLLLAHRADPNGHERFGRTPLSQAVYWGNLKAARLLVAHGGRYTYSPLLTAIAQGKVEEVKKVLDRDPALVNAANVDRVTPLYQAVTWGRWDIARLLLENGASVDALSDHGVRQPERSSVGQVPQDTSQLFITFRATETPLLQAIHLQNVELVQLLLHHRANVDGPAQAEVTPLQQAVQTRNTSLVLTLLNAGAAINGKVPGGYPPLFLAVLNTDTAMIDLLLDHGADIHAKLADGTTLLHTAAGADNLPLVTRLLDAGLAVNAENNSHVTPLDIAIATGPFWTPPTGPGPGFYGKVAVLLRKHGGYDGHTHTPPLFYFVGQCDVETVKAMLKRDPRSSNLKDDSGHTPIFWATQILSPYGTEKDRNLEQIIDALLEAGADLNTEKGIGYTLLLEAVILDNEALVRLLLDKGAQINAMGSDGSTALHCAAQFGDKNMVALLITRGADINSRDNQGNSPLTKARFFMRPDVESLLRKHGGIDDSYSAMSSAIMIGDPVQILEILKTNPGILKSTDGDKHPSLLYDAIQTTRRPDIIALLIAKGADVNHKEAKGETPLALAILFGKDSIVAVLRKHGAHYGISPIFDAVVSGDETKTALLLAETPSLVNIKDTFGQTPLHVAVRLQNTRMAKLLLERHADINEKEKSNQTSLEVAVYQGDEKTVALLLAQGADTNLSYMPGESPLTVALGRGYPGIATLLRQHGAKP
jgi:ankyrin repeat protein